MGALLGNLDGVRLLGLLREKENACVGSFFLDPEDLKFKSGAPSGTSAKNKAPLS